LVYETDEQQQQQLQQAQQGNASTTVKTDNGLELDLQQPL
jgi:hypothetical protein